MKYWMGLNQICGYVAMWSVRQSPYPCPEGLEDVLRVFRERIAPKFDRLGFAHLGLDDLEKMLRANLLGIPQVDAWNSPKCGSHTLLVVSAWDQVNPDHDFIDLDALVRNVVHSAEDEARLADMPRPSTMPHATIGA